MRLKRSDLFREPVTVVYIENVCVVQSWQQTDADVPGPADDMELSVEVCDAGTPPEYRSDSQESSRVLGQLSTPLHS